MLAKTSHTTNTFTYSCT